MQDSILLLESLNGGGGQRAVVTGGVSVKVAQIFKRLLKLDDQTVVYPGHGMRTKIGWERRSFQ